MTSHLRINTNIDEHGNLGAPFSPWPSPSASPDNQVQQSVSKEEAILAFEMASMRLNDIIAKHKTAEKVEGDTLDLRPESWSKNAPGFEYKGKRTNKGMPDKRTRAGKEWYASVMV